MKLTFLFLLASAPLLLCSTNYYILGVLDRFTSASFSPFDYQMPCALGVYVGDVDIGTGFYFKISITGDNFAHGNMYVGGSVNRLPDKSTVNLETPISHYFYDSSRKSYQFYVYKDNNYNYLYIAPPPPTNYQIKSTITVLNAKSAIYYVLGDIYKFRSSTFTPTEKGLFGLLCLDTNDFPKEEYYYFQTKISRGAFANGFMYYGASNARFPTGQEITLENYVTPYSSSAYYDLHTFRIRRVAERYLYVAAPPPAYNYYNSLSKVTVYNTYRDYEQLYKLIGELTQYSNETFSPSRDGIYVAYYIKMEDFSKEDEIYFNSAISNGEFEHEYMFYTSSDTLFNYGTSLSLTSNVKRDFAGTTFTIKKPNYKYLYVAPPPAFKFSSSSIISISNEKKSNSNKVAIGVGIGVGAAVLIAIIIIIVVVKNKNESVESTEIDTKNEPIHLGATHY